MVHLIKTVFFKLQDFNDFMI